MERGGRGLRLGAAALGGLALRLAGAAAGLAFVAIAMGLGLVLAGAFLLWGLLRPAPGQGGRTGAAWRPGRPPRVRPAPAWPVRHQPPAGEVVDVEARTLSPSGPPGA